MKVAYLLNQYPMPSQTFVRRELAALESAGWTIQRYSIRSVDPGEVVDPEDRAERERTRYLLGAVGAASLLLAVARTVIGSPGAFVAAARAALALGRRSRRGPLMHLVYLAEACVVRAWAAADGIDHIHSHFGTNAPVVALLVRRLGGPSYSFTIHGPEEFDAPEALHLRDKVHDAAFVVVISSFGRSQLLRWCDQEDWPKVRVVRCGLDESFLGRRTTPNPANRRLVCVGRLAEQKGQLLLVEAVRRLRDEGVDVELVLAGEGPMRPAIEDAIRRWDLADSIRITGWIDNAAVRTAVDGARALVLPSFAEGLPVAIMEALALGRPVISTMVAGIPELVDDDCGWLVPAGSVEALADAMRDALDAAPARLDEMGRVGRSRVLARHDADTEAAALADAFRELVP